MTPEEEIAVLKNQLQLSKDAFELFAYSVSHDMREPVRMVKSFMDLLMRKYSDTLDEKAKSYITFATEGAGRADLMIQDLLFYYRSVRDMKPGPADLNLAFAGAAGKLKQQLEARQTVISCPVLPWVTGDVAGLQDVFIYLLKHLLQLVPLADQPKLDIGVRQEGTHWEITLTSNGIAPETGELRDLFRLFHNRAQQVSSDSTLNKLAVARRIVDHLGGSLIAGQSDSTGAVYFTIKLCSANEQVI